MLVYTKAALRRVLPIVARTIVVVVVVMWGLWFVSGWVWIQSSWPQASFLLGGGRLFYGFGTAAHRGYFTQGMFTWGPRHGGPQWLWWDYRCNGSLTALQGDATLTPFGVGLPIVAGGFWLAARKLRRAAHVCVRCEYDLRGLPTRRCPECGTVNPREWSVRKRVGMSATPSEKRELRARLSTAIGTLSPAQRSARSAAACGRALESDLFPAGSTVMLYVPMVEKGEVDLRLVAEGLAARGCRLCVPRVDWAKGTMTPAVLENLATDLIPDAGSPGRGMHGPRADAPEVAPADLAVVVVPGLGFDERGNRIGRGAGFYDKFLGGLARGKPVRVALAFNEQVVPSVPVEGHDAGVDVIVTPTRVIRVGSTGAAG